jgi:hypothetical protein
MKKIKELLSWLTANKFHEGVVDIEQMQVDPNYAQVVEFEPDEQRDTMATLLMKTFTWENSVLGEDYWEDIFERLCIFEENV